MHTQRVISGSPWVALELAQVSALNHLRFRVAYAAASPGDILSLMGSHHQLRRETRRARRSLTRDQQRAHAEQLARHIFTSDIPLKAKTVAGYVCADGEIDVSDTLVRLHRCGKRIALPVIDPLSRRLNFYEHHPDVPLVSGFYGIPVPPPGARFVPLMSLDVVLTPLVAFDHHGTRLGMGGGYYDRTFGTLPPTLRPALVGVAHALQEAPAPIVRRAWDVPIDGLFTEQGERILQDCA